MAIKGVQLNFRITVELYDKLEAYCSQTGESKTEVIGKALEAYLKGGKRDVPR